MKVIGLNAFHGDSAACLFIDGQMVAAAEEERFRRIKHWAGFPSKAIEYCIEHAGVRLADIDVIAINTDPSAARFRKLGFLLSGEASWGLVKEKLLVRGKREGIEAILEREFPDQTYTGKVEFVEHHLAHLASAYNVSPYETASIVSVDGFGDFASAAWGLGTHGDIDLQKRVYFPHSMGIFYQALTQSLGFPNYGDEYKVMGLAPYGEPKYRGQMDQIVSVFDDGTFELNLDYFIHHKQAIGYEWENGSPKIGRLYADKISELLGPIRKPNEELTQHHFDMARSIQDAYERTFFHLLNHVHKEHSCANLTIAGGCGMNSVANGKVHLNTPFENIYVQSAAGDAGGAIGAAVIASRRQGVTSSFKMQHSYWGNQYSQTDYTNLLEESSKELTNNECEVQLGVEDAELYDIVSDCIIDGKVIGWFQGAMEWGPRALGNRSILGDPRRDDMKDILNLKIKRRESFRPFAPSVLREEVSQWFESDADVPFMMKVFQIKEEQRAKVPAVTHVDGSGRLQTVSKETNERYYHLIKAFFDKTKVPMLLNTSFNENEPVVCTPEEALACFLRTNMDVLVLGSNIIKRLN
jgi:carbamoyltransferase